MLSAKPRVRCMTGRAVLGLGARFALVIGTGACGHYWIIPPPTSERRRFHYPQEIPEIPTPREMRCSVASKPSPSLTQRPEASRRQETCSARKSSKNSGANKGTPAKQPHTQQLSRKITWANSFRLGLKFPGFS
ncbi:hypothetical protein K432DRAFT_441032 [Lepidopterella palustris CBS 459.81]|uniref:Uncharacterized protein n=1 Tax=Lepidopterella palustris CBS 459.81 TaxID=1314670 RepID=A0A8E2JIF3_9PEZI|nr:hypothetical protein K432DRAFT_441032 [Lepidopterella palustris CBS 459.81]